jgi:group I intron endonuclease
MGYIYCITSPSGKQYIGQTKRNYNKRFNEHCKLLKSCILLENAIKKYGKDNMKFEILLEINNNLLDEYEKSFINMLSTLEPYGYNIRNGGSKGFHSELSRQRMRDSKLGEKNHNFGKPRSDETKMAISNAKSGVNHHFYGKTLSQEHKLELSKAHKKTCNDLPMYMVYVKERHHNYQASGYAIVNHPTLTNKYFTSKKLSDEEKLNMAYEYLSSSMNAVQRLNGDGSYENKA